MGMVGSVSLIGTFFGMPYVAAVLENTILRTPFIAQACARLMALATLLRKYLPGSFMDSPTSMNAAKWITPSGWNSLMVFSMAA